MTLHRKTLLVVTFTLAVLIVLLYLILRTLLIRSFSSLEQQMTLRDLNRAEISLQDYAASMEREVHDWSTWDETYQFVQDSNASFIASNLSDSTFSSLDVNLMLFVNTADEIIYSKAVTLEADWPDTLLSQLETYARSDAGFLRVLSSAPTSGLVVVDGEPLLVASRPILHSDESGPKAGTLIWGRYLGPQELLELSQSLQLSVGLLPLNVPNLSSEDQAAHAALTITEPRSIIPVNEITIHGYALLSDIYGQPALVLKTTQDRAIYAEGQASLIYFMAALAAVGIVFAVVVLLLLERLMLAPLGHLSGQVRRIGVHDDFSMRLPVAGRDEFAQLAATLNTMLNLIAQSRAVLQRERNLLRLLIDTIPATVYVKDIHSRFVDANLETALQMGANSSNDLIGKTDFDFFSPELAEKYFADEQALFQSGQALLNIEELNFDYRTQQERRLLTTKVPILDEHGAVTGLVGVSLDITARTQANEQVEQERNLLRTLIDQLPDYIFIKDAEGRFINSNAAHNQIARVKDADALRGKYAFEVFPPELSAQFVVDDERVLQSGQALVNVERTSLNAQGQVCTVLTTKVPLRNGSGTVTGLVGISRDITERKQAEQALQAKAEAEHHFQIALEALSAISIELTQIDHLDDFYRRVVELALERLGFDRIGLLLYDAEHTGVLGTYGTDVQGHVLDEHDLQLDPANVTDTLKRALENSERFAFDEHTPLFDRSEALGYGWNAAAMLWNGTQSLGWISVDNAVQHQPASSSLLEILALYAQIVGTLLGRKRLEQTLRENEAKLQTFFEVLPVGVSVLNSDDEIVEMNPALERILGMSMEGIMAGRYRSRRYIHNDGTPMKREDFPSVRVRVEQRAIHDVIVGVIKEDQTMVWTNVSAVPLPESNSGVITVTTDITERKQAEAQTFALAVERQRVQVLHQFIGDATHDLMTPIAVINTSTELARMAPDQERLIKHLDKIERMSETLQDRMQDMLTLSQLDMMTAADLEFWRVDLAQLLQRLIETFHPRAEAKGQQLIGELDPQADTLQADNLYLAMALAKVVENAIHYTDNGGTVYISIARHETQVSIAIRDTGIGIAEADLAHVFERFYRAKSNRPLDSGAGLGLSIAQRIVDLHRGRIEATSILGSGSTFTFLLPSG